MSWNPQPLRVPHLPLPPVTDDKGWDFVRVREKMHLAISMSRTNMLDSVLDEFRTGYLSLSREDRKKLLLVLAREYDIDRVHVRELIDHYVKLNNCASSQTESPMLDLDGPLYRIRWALGHALRPTYAVLFERLKRRYEGPNFCALSSVTYY